MKKLSDKGLTIVELLIVFTIITILAIVGFTSYNTALQKEKKSQAQSTVMQVKSRLNQYFTDASAYPATKADLITYLNKSKETQLVALFDAPNNPYLYKGSGKDECTTAENDCSSFSITVSKSYWHGGGDDTDITVAP